MIKIRNYTNEDIEYIKNNYNELTTKQIAQVLNKSESSIYNAIRKLGLKNRFINRGLILKIYFWKKTI